jgi:hypothetical protein
MEKKRLKLFDVVPHSLFRPLVSPGAEIYFAALFAIFEAQSFDPFLQRNVLLEKILDALEVPNALDLTKDALTEDNTDDSEVVPLPEDANTQKGRASFILRYFVQKGWMREETSPSQNFTRAYTMPHYAQRILEVLHDIAMRETLPIRGLICNIRDVLQNAANEGSIEIRLPEAHRNTQQLRSRLSELQDRMREHIQQIAQANRTSAALNELSDYHVNISDFSYHQLKTTDHVSRFRPQILDAITKLEEINRLMAGVRALVAQAEVPTESEGLSLLMTEIQFIREQFETLDHHLDALDSLNSRYMKTLARTIERDIYANSIMSERLLTILSTLLHGNGTTLEESLLEDIHLSVNLFTFSTFDDRSLAAPREAPQSFSAAPSLPSERVEPRDPKTANHDLLKQIRVAHGASRPQIRQFATHLLSEKEELYASEIPISEPNRDIPRLMLLWAYGDGSLGYHVLELPEAPLVRHAEIDLEFQDFLICKGPLLEERRKQQR